jgi:hypothetical protein
MQSTEDTSPRVLLKAREPGEQLAEVRKKIAEAAAEIERLDGEIARSALPILRGDAEADRIAAQLEHERRRIAGEQPILREAEAQLENLRKAEEEAGRRAAAEALPADLAALRTGVLQIDDEIEALAAQLAAKCRERVHVGRCLAERSSSVQLKRNADSLVARIRSTAARHFVINPGAGAASAANNLLGIVGDFVGEAAHWTLRQHDEPMLDNLCPCFATEAEALAGKDRLAARRTGTVVDKIGATRTLIRVDSLFADRAEAEQFVARSERTGARYTIVPRGPGFVVLPAPLAESAAALAPAGAA